MVDTTAPTLSITSPSTSINAESTAAINFSFSENVGTSFTQSDISTTNSNFINLQGTGASYSGFVKAAALLPTNFINWNKNQGDNTYSYLTQWVSLGNNGAYGDSAKITFDARTIIGKTYTLTFELGNYFVKSGSSGTNAGTRAEVSYNDGVTASTTYQVNYTSFQTEELYSGAKTITFTAKSTSTTIAFSTLNDQVNSESIVRTVSLSGPESIAVNVAANSFMDLAGNYNNQTHSWVI
jgi:hypothetical protein